jgi:hypothetical protein
LAEHQSLISVLSSERFPESRHWRDMNLRLVRKYNEIHANQINRHCTMILTEGDWSSLPPAFLFWGIRLHALLKVLILLAVRS